MLCYDAVKNSLKLDGIWYSTFHRHTTLKSAVSLMHCKYVTYLQLDNKSDSNGLIGLSSNLVIITSLVGPVAKYCNEHICLSVGLSTCISPEACMIFTKYFVHVACAAPGCGSVLIWQDDASPRGRGNFGGFLPYTQGENHPIFMKTDMVCYFQ